ncbi:hypothetical protein CI41S_67570 [Bradyrhizobium ivorense]|nr:hypothetical protein CI41S_67570 [Bradyrhizobium ivorense]
MSTAASAKCPAAGIFYKGVYLMVLEHAADKLRS